MIVKMKKLSLLLYHQEKQDFLKALQELGVVHVVENTDAVSDSLSHKIALSGQYQRIIKKFEAIKKEHTPNVPAKDTQDPLEVMVGFEKLENDHERTDQKIAGLQKQEATLLPWGNFDSDQVKKLAEANVHMRFYEASTKVFEQLDLQTVTYEEINRVGNQVYFIVFGQGDIDADEVKLPEVSLNSIQSDIAREQKHLESLNSQVQEYTAYTSSLASHLAAHTNKENFEKAGLSMEAQTGGKLFHFSGWLPAEKQQEVTAFLDKFSVIHEIEEPTQKDNVPVLLKNNRFSKLFEPITKIFALPSYFELDPTPFFAPFFAFFFGMCLGDVGYGLILLAATIGLLAKGPQKLKPIAMLGIVLSIMTILNGFFLNTFFGNTIFAIMPSQKDALFSGGGVLAPLGSFASADGQMVYPAMSFAIMLGVIQVMLGMALQAYNKIVYQGRIWGLQPISNLMMFAGALLWAAADNIGNLGTFVIGPLAVGKLLTAPPGILGKLLFAGGFVMLIAFSSPGSNIFTRPLTGLWAFYNFIVDLMGNVLSYLRLFALGLASGLLGNAFNQIAFMFVKNEDGSLNLLSIGIIGTVLVLIIGHTLNLALSALGSFVHPLRLTFVEFYKNVQFAGGGKAFSPFAIQKKPS